MQKSLIIANFKMNPTSAASARALLGGIKRGLSSVRNVEVVVAPPFPYLALAGSTAGRIRLGAQNVFWEEAGAFTGEVSPAMLRDLGVSYVIVGHSERRRIFSENDEMVNHKVRIALAHRLIPVIAIGEDLEESQEVVPPILAHQLSRALAGIPKKRLRGIVIAYEPVWAIGTGTADTPDNATRRAIYIRQRLTKLLGSSLASTIRILYGGSVTSKNAASFLARDIRGIGFKIAGMTIALENARNLVAKLAWALWPAWVWFSVMATANHFWLDVVAGVAVAVVALAIVHRRRLVRLLRTA